MSEGTVAVTPEAFIGVLKTQRNNIMDEAAMLSAALETERAESARLRAVIAERDARIAELEKTDGA